MTSCPNKEPGAPFCASCAAEKITSLAIDVAKASKSLADMFHMLTVVSASNRQKAQGWMDSLTRELGFVMAAMDEIEAGRGGNETGDLSPQDAAAARHLIQTCIDASQESLAAALSMNSTDIH